MVDDSDDLKESDGAMAKGLWLQISIDLLNHPKLKRFARILDIPRAQAVGHLFALWSWALRYYPEGQFPSDEEEIAENSSFEGDPQEFVDALCDCGKRDNRLGFLERDSANGGYVLHDWAEYSGNLEKKREQTIERSRRYREKKKIERDVTVTLLSRDNHVAVTLPSRQNHAREQEQELELELEQEQNTLSRGQEKTPDSRDGEKIDSRLNNLFQKARAASESEYNIEFQRLWKVYPNKKGKEAARKSFVKFRKMGVQLDVFIQGLEGYLTSIKALGTAPQYIMHGSTFFGPDRKWEDYLEKDSYVATGVAEPTSAERFAEEIRLKKEVFNGDGKLYSAWVSAGSPQPAVDWLKERLKQAAHGDNESSLFENAKAQRADSGAESDVPWLR